MEGTDNMSACTVPTRCDRLLLGDFDGIHLGHRALFSGITAESIVFTFSQNTKRTMGLIGATLYPETVNRRLMAGLGLRRIYYADFAAIRDMSPSEFVDHIISLFSPQTVVCGENFTFGKGASGDSRTLSALLWAKGVGCVVVPSVRVQGTVVSSSAVRAHVADGDMESAGALLGLPYSIFGTVVHGKALGRRIGTPTVNLPIYDGCVVPRLGVYISQLTVGGRKYAGVTNVGVRPTVDDGNGINTETFLLGFDGEIYGCDVTLSLCKYIREERKFDDTASLARQILEDSEKSARFFEKFTVC